MKDLDFCVSYLSKENGYNPKDIEPSYKNLRALMNVTMPYRLDEEFYKAQDRTLQDLLKTKKIISLDDLKASYKNIYLYKGDITLLRCDSIVNACNEKLLGCFSPLHGCIDNAIHSFAGLEVRRDLLDVMTKQGCDEPNGMVKVTKGYNLPSKYIFHTVGPKAFGHVSKQNEIDLRNCYLSCLRKANEMNLESICFCSLSTGVYGYPIEDASKVAIGTVVNFMESENKSIKKIIFSLFSDRDYEVYSRRIKEIDK